MLPLQIPVNACYVSLKENLNYGFLCGRGREKMDKATHTCILRKGGGKNEADVQYSCGKFID